VLVFDEEVPFPPNSGKRIRTWNLLRRMASRHSVSFLCYGDASDKAAEAVEKAGIRLHLVPPKRRLEGWQLYGCLFFNLFSIYPFSVSKHYSFRFERKLRELLEATSWDLIHCEWSPYARFLPSDCPIPVLISTHNVESQILARRASHSRNPIAKLFFTVQEIKMRWCERRFLDRASVTTAVSIGDASSIRSWGVRTVRVVPNGIEVESYLPAPEVEVENEILILASLDWHANVDALEYFIQDVFPLVRERRPGALLRVVGRNPSESLRKSLSGTPGVDWIGEVEDVRIYLDRASVVVVPLRIGGGSRIKILEALAAGKAVVSTTVGAEGLEVVPGVHLRIADSPSEFALGIDELLQSKESRRKLGDAGRRLVEERYGWDQISRDLESVWYEISERSGIRDSQPLLSHNVSVSP
jgi:polysaccharide biosynthesis protein PslH